MPKVKELAHAGVQTAEARNYIKGKDFGINFFTTSPKQITSGTEAGASSNLAAIHNSGIPYSVNKISTYLSIPSHIDFSDKSYRSVNFFNLNADQLAFLYHLLGRKYFSSSFNIAYWFWELSETPERWRGILRCLHEVWTASEFSRQAIQKKTSAPVITIPPMIEFSLPQANRLQFQIPEDKFVFLFTFDFRSYFERKNPMGIIKAFCNAFQNSTQTHLVLHCHGSERFPHQKRELIQSTLRHHNIQVIDSVLTQVQSRSLIACCDSYVSLHRSEGFGITIAEAMLLKKPVIVTNYSGNTDFTTEENSFLVDHHLIPILKTVGPYIKGNVWAEPSIEHAAQLMKVVFKEKSSAQAKAEKGSKTIEGLFSGERITELVKNRFALTGTGFN